MCTCTFGCPMVFFYHILMKYPSSGSLNTPLGIEALVNGCFWCMYRWYVGMATRNQVWFLLPVSQLSWMTKCELFFSHTLIPNCLYSIENWTHAQYYIFLYLISTSFEIEKDEKTKWKWSMTSLGYELKNKWTHTWQAFGISPGY